MKKGRTLALILAVLMAVMLFGACSTQTPAATDTTATEPTAAVEEATEPETTEASAEPITITYFNTSAEVNSMFEAMFARYHELNPNVTIELIPTGVGEGQQEKLQSLYASGNAPTFMNVDPANVIEYQDNLLELTYETAPWLEQANNGVIDAGTFGGKILGVPFSVQGYGLLYNKRVITEVFGDSFDQPRSTRRMPSKRSSKPSKQPASRRPCSMAPTGRLAVTS